MFMGREKMQEKLLRDLPTVFRTVLKTHHLAPGDFPDIDNFRNRLLDMNFGKFPKLKSKLLAVRVGYLCLSLLLPVYDLRFTCG